MKVSLSSPKLEVLPYTGNNGFYSAVTPVPESANFLSALASSFNVHPDKSAFHCTVMYSPEGCPSSDIVKVDPSKTFVALCNGVDYWSGHDNKGYLSARVTSLSLQAEHRRLLDLGCIHTYVPYTPHITLWSDIEKTVELMNMIGSINATFASEQVSLMFTNQIISDIAP